MTELIKFYLTEANFLGINLIAVVVLLIVTAYFIAKDRDRLVNILFTLAIIVFFSSFLVLSASHYETVSSNEWRQIYSRQDKGAKVTLTFKDLEIKQSSLTNITSKSLEAIDSFQKDSNSDLQEVSIKLSTKSGDEEHIVYLSKDNQMSKDQSKNNIVIEKIEYRKIDGIQRHLGRFTGNVEKSAIDDEIRITYKNDDSRQSVFDK